jgi:hypothetical protein
MPLLPVYKCNCKEDACRNLSSPPSLPAIAIYAPLIYTAPCVLFLMCADTLRGQVGGGWVLEIESFLGPVKWHQTDRQVPIGAQKNSKKPKIFVFNY